MEKSPHILNTSSNLLGLCFIVLTSLKVLKLQQGTIIDELTVGAAISFMVSCTTSFLSIRSSEESKSIKFEKIADFFFLCGLAIMFMTTMLISFDIIK